MPTLTTLPQTAGTAYLKFTRNGSETVLTRSFAASPVKVFATKGGRSACWVYTATLGGGFVGGDEIQMTVEVEAGARALLSTQASTKVYRSLRPASQKMSATVDAGALLVVMPDPIVCFTSADFLQTQDYALHADANLVVVDWMTSGRHRAGERWAFSRYESRLTITRDARPVFYDALVLESDLDSIVERIGRFEVLLTAVLMGPLVREAASVIQREVLQSTVVKDAGLIVSASPLGKGGTLVRIAGMSVEQVGRVLREYLNFLSPLLGDDPWSRKW
ncbi:MAG TPA: urease accessory protein UreD [Vicinamibacterales bacterium]|nr:urease accessory protein UreD [Vicinamibacterales bacterium]